MYHQQVHKGFFKASRNVLDVITKELSELRKIFGEEFKIVVTGHSLGAALATLTIADLGTSFSNLELVNFGSPRVGNDEFAEWFSLFTSQRSRITHHKDIVPHCPMHERFTHVSGEWYHEDDTGVDIRPCTGFEDPQVLRTNISDSEVHSNILIPLLCISVLTSGMSRVSMITCTTLGSMFNVNQFRD